MFEIYSNYFHLKRRVYFFHNPMRLRGKYCYRIRRKLHNTVYSICLPITVTKKKKKKKIIKRETASPIQKILIKILPNFRQLKHNPLEFIAERGLPANIECL